MKLNRRGDIFMVAPAVINDSCDQEADALDSVENIQKCRTPWLPSPIIIFYREQRTWHASAAYLNYYLLLRFVSSINVLY